MSVRFNARPARKRAGPTSPCGIHALSPDYRLHSGGNHGLALPRAGWRLVTSPIFQLRHFSAILERLAGGNRFNAGNHRYAHCWAAGWWPVSEPACRAGGRAIPRG